MKFKFPLQALLRHRERLEEMAKKEYMLAQNKVNETLGKINEMWEEIDNTRKNKIEEQHKGGTKGQLLASMDEFIVGHKIRVEREKVKLRELMLIAEEKKELLIEAAKEHKILQRLKEKMMEKHKIMIKKKEVKDIDDIVTTRFKRSL
ncbi:MAG: flagellar export protein FliJ [Bdellovibrionaceae bacterium]|nr:flagellar export protein FliJ [Pseudobdellovibrionaceae bacterium]